MVDPKIGFAVICRCRDGQQALEVLCVRRDQSSHAPGKWSFPGGKLAAGEESEEKRVLAKVETQCAGGDPLGLPPLIHIIRLYNESSTRVSLGVQSTAAFLYRSVHTYAADDVAVLLMIGLSIDCSVDCVWMLEYYKCRLSPRVTTMSSFSYISVSKSAKEVV